MEEEPKPQQNIENNSEKKKNLNDLLNNLNEKTFNIINAIYNLEKVGMVDLIPNLMKVEFDYYLKKLLNYRKVTSNSRSSIFDDYTGGSHDHVAGSFFQYRNKGIVPHDYEYAEVGNAFLGIRAATNADEGYFSEARYWYEQAGMTEKADEFKEFEPKANTFDDVVRPQKGWPRMDAEVEEAQEKLKDFPLLSDEEREAIIANVREKVEAEISKY